MLRQSEIGIEFKQLSQLPCCFELYYEQPFSHENAIQVSVCSIQGSI